MSRRRSKHRRDARYAAAVRRQIEFNQSLAAYRIPHTPIEQFLRPGDTADQFAPPTSDPDRPDMEVSS